LFLGEVVAGGLNLVEDVAVEPGGVAAGDEDGDALFTDGGVVVAPGLLDVGGLEGFVVPGGLFFANGEGAILGVFEGHGDFFVFGDDVGEGVAAGDVGGVGGVDAGLHGGDADGDVGGVDGDEVADGANGEGGTAKGEQELFRAERALGGDAFFAAGIGV